VGYDDCGNGAICLPDEFCLVDAVGNPSWGVCSRSPCADPSECPLPPPGGNPTVRCEDLTNNLENDCYLSCASGETCPDGMFCFIDDLCVWDVASGYGDCVNFPQGDACLGTEICIVDEPADPTLGVCGDQGCTVPGDCPIPPPGGNAVTTCADITNDATNDCYLDCSGDGTCPLGMRCAGGFLCVHDELGPPPPGFGDCFNNAAADVCLFDEACLFDDLNNPTSAVCMWTPCNQAADCPASPPGGNAPVDCVDLLGSDGIGECVLRCDNAETCPTGMFCFDNLVCMHD
jgi:hypothetical protein